MHNMDRMDKDKFDKTEKMERIDGMDGMYGMHGMDKMGRVNKMNKMDKNRAMLLNKISKAGFVLYDLQLYLDTHPTDMHALKTYEYYQKKCDAMKKEYENMYGPLTPKLTDGADKWTWYEGPWPWEREYNVEP